MYYTLIIYYRAHNFVIYSMYRVTRKVIESLAWLRKKLLLIIGMQRSSHKVELIVTGVATSFCPTNLGILINTVSEKFRKGKNM